MCEALKCARHLQKGKKEKKKNYLLFKSSRFGSESAPVVVEIHECARARVCVCVCVCVLFFPSVLSEQHSTTKASKMLHVLLKDTSVAHLGNSRTHADLPNATSCCTLRGRLRALCRFSPRWKTMFPPRKFHDLMPDYITALCVFCVPEQNGRLAEPVWLGALCIGGSVMSFISTTVREREKERGRERKRERKRERGRERGRERERERDREREREGALFGWRRGNESSD